jgi:hypothetical protein
MKVSEPRDFAEILRVEVGSGLHGIAIEGTDDRDEMGIFIEPPESVFGWKLTEHDVWRTQPEGHRSGPGDVDLVRYGLRKYLRLAVQGNPTILLPLFAPAEKILAISRHGEELIGLRGAIISRQAGPRFLGYMDSQIARLEGRRSMPTTRTELVKLYGFDTKFASHALRLAIQGVFLLRHGFIQLPMEDPFLSLVRSIKQGHVKKDEAMAYIYDWREQLVGLLQAGSSPLRERPDYGALTEWSTSVHVQHWSY